MVESRELHTGGLEEPSFIRGGFVVVGRETSAHEPLADGARTTEYCNFAPVSIAALTAWAEDAGLDADLGRSTFVEYDASENAKDSCEYCLATFLGVLGGDLGARGGDDNPFGLCLSFGAFKDCSVSSDLFVDSDLGAGSVFGKEACEELGKTT
jgi:hypothetical protein